MGRLPDECLFDDLQIGLCRGDAQQLVMGRRPATRLNAQPLVVCVKHWKPRWPGRNRACQSTIWLGSVQSREAAATLPRENDTGLSIGSRPCRNSLTGNMLGQYWRSLPRIQISVLGG